MKSCDILKLTLTAALLTTGKRWAQSTCALTDKWINKMSYTCNGVQFSH